MWSIVKEIFIIQVWKGCISLLLRFRNALQSSQMQKEQENELFIGVAIFQKQHFSVKGQHEFLVNS